MPMGFSEKPMSAKLIGNDTCSRKTAKFVERASMWAIMSPMPTWDELFEDERYRWKHINEHVVAFAALLKNHGARRVLDLGCGAGRHTVFLARQGFEVCGLDIAETGLKNTRDWLTRENLSAELKQGEIEQIPCPDESFDAVVSIYVIYHKTLAGMKRTIAEIRRVLCPGGLALISLQSKRGYRYGDGKEIEPDSFIPTVGADAGEVHHYSDLAEIQRLFVEFLVRKAELEEYIEEGSRHSHWQVLVEKER
jgi:tellurite methyltransferase